MIDRSPRYTDVAKQNLKEIAKYTQQRWGRAQRVLYLQAISAAMETLRIRPNTGRVVDGYEPLTHRFRSGSHFIYYRFDDLTLTVLMVLHIGMEPSLHLE